MPVGDPDSVISSILAESELILRFNDIQLQCYVLLKILLKDKLKQFFPETLSGYQIKNLLFWKSEEYGDRIFTQENLTHCLKICFDRFKDQILYDSLLHCIQRDRYLLTGKLENKIKKGWWMK